MSTDTNPVESQSDSEAKAHMRQIEYLRSLTGEQRAKIAFKLSDRARQRLIADIKKQHPEFTKRQVLNEVIRKCYGEKLFQEVAAAKGWK